MRSKTPIVYVPALRLKKGERYGLKRLEPDVADRIAPRLVVPPSKERDAENKWLPSRGRDDGVYEIGRRIGTDWPMLASVPGCSLPFPGAWRGKHKLASADL